MERVSNKVLLLVFFITIAVAMFAGFPAMAQFGDLLGMGLGEIPGIDIGMKDDPPISTSFDDAVTSVPFLDEYPPERSFAACEMPRGPKGGYIVQPGTYQTDLWSYCLHAGTHGPGQGNGYIYAPLKGKRAVIIQNILSRTESVNVNQHDVQALIWAILARTKISEMDNEMKLVASKLLTEKELLELEGGVLGLVPQEAWDKAFGKLPPGVREVYEAEANLRNMFTTGYSSFDELERVAVLAGEPEDDKGPKIPSGRWSYHPDGYFVRYRPSGYSDMHMEMLMPHPCTVTRDSTGRIVSVADNRDYKLALEYDESVSPASVKDVKGLVAYKVKEFVFTRPNTIRPWNLDETRWNANNWVASSANVKASGKGDSGLDALGMYLKQTDGETAALLKSAGVKGGKGAGSIPVFLELASVVYSVKSASSYTPFEGEEDDLWENRYVARESDYLEIDLAQFGQSQTATADPSPDAVRLSYDSAMNEFLTIISANSLPPAYPVGKSETKEPQVPTCFPSWMEPTILKTTPVMAGGRGKSEFSGGGVASPANRGRQRLAVSNKPKFGNNNDDDDEDEEPHREIPQMENPPRNDEPKPGRETFNRAKEVLSWTSVVTFGMDVLTSGPGMALANQVGSGIPGAGADAVVNFNMDMGEKISNALSGDPPDPNYKVIAEAEILNPTPIGPIDGVPAARIEALNRVLTASCQLTANGRAATASLDRHGGALAAGDEEWIYIQRGEILKHKRNTGMAMLMFADAFEQYALELKSEGITDMLVTPDAVRNYQNRLRTTGWTPAELEAASFLGVTDAQLEEMKQVRLSADPNMVSGSFFVQAAKLIAAYREMGVYLMTLPEVE